MAFEPFLGDSLRFMFGAQRRGVEPRLHMLCIQLALGSWLFVPTQPVAIWITNAHIHRHVVRDKALTSSALFPLPSS